MTAVFTYGSLMYDAVWRKVVCGQYPSTSAVLAGYERRGVVGEHYPALIPSARPGSVVQGRLYFDLSEQDLYRLDLFEGDYYRRLSCEVSLAGGQRLVAGVYVWRSRFNSRVSARAWNPEDFERRGLALFQRRYRGFA